MFLNRTLYENHTKEAEVYAPLSDVVTCPRCGPGFGLIMLAERVADRRAYDAWLGCPNCRERYRVRGGYASLSFPPEGERGGGGEGAGESREAARLLALMGVAEGPALVLVVGAGAVNAALVADLVEGLEVVAAWSPLADSEEREGVSRFATPGAILPFRSGSMRAVALTDEASFALIEEAARVVIPRSRVVVESGSVEIAERLERAGLRVLAKDEQATVAQRTAF